MKKFALCCLILLSSFSLVSSASGDTIPYNIKGIVGWSTGYSGVAIGDTWTASFRVDTAVPDLEPSTPNLGKYDTYTPFDLKIGSSLTRHNSNFQIFVDNSHGVNYDEWSVYSPIFGPNVSPPDSIGIRLTDLSKTAFNSDVLPASISLSMFNQTLMNFSLVDPSGEFHSQISGYVTAINIGQPVPEPATLLLLGSGLVGLIGFRRKFRKN